MDSTLRYNSTIRQPSGSLTETAHVRVSWFIGLASARQNSRQMSAQNVKVRMLFTCGVMHSEKSSEAKNLKAFVDQLARTRGNSATGVSETSQIAQQLRPPPGIHFSTCAWFGQQIRYGSCAYRANAGSFRACSCSRASQDVVEDLPGFYSLKGRQRVNEFIRMSGRDHFDLFYDHHIDRPVVISRVASE